MVDCRSNHLKRAPTLTLFYVRFALDGFKGFFNILMIAFTFIKLFNLTLVDLASYQTCVFYVVWISSNFFSVRALLSIIITFDRALAVFLPIAYRRSRANFSNLTFVIIVFCYPVINNFVLWKVCDFSYDFQSRCAVFVCLVNTCYDNFGIRFEIFSQSLMAITTLALTAKLFLMNHCKNGKPSKNLTRANYLALLDTFIIVIFDVIPSTFIKYLPPASEVGSLFSFFRMAGYAVEAILAQKALKRKSEVAVSTNLAKSNMIDVH